MLGGARQYFDKDEGEKEVLNIHQDLKLDADLVAKLVMNQHTPPKKYREHLELQANQKNDKGRTGNKPPAPVQFEDEAPASTAPAAVGESKEVGANYQKDNNFKTASSMISASLITQALEVVKTSQPIEEKLTRLKVYLHCLPPSTSGLDFISMKVAVSPRMVIEDVIKAILVQYNEEKRKPALVENPALFEMRTCSEDEDEEEDDFVLDRKSEIAKCGFTIVALAKVIGVTTDQILVDTGDGATLPKLQGGKEEMRLCRVSMENERFVLQVPKTNTLDKLLFAVAKKRKEVMNVENFEFVAEEKVCEWDMLVMDLPSENVDLRRKAKNSSTLVKVVSGTSNAPQPSDFFFTWETASQYKEYDVIKHKGRLRQKRVMGIDANRIANLPPSTSSEVPSTFTMPTIMSITKVKRAGRDMTDVVKAEMIQGHAKMFQILFRDLETNAIVPYQYEASSEFECAEIVAKIEFLRKVT